MSSRFDIQLLGSLLPGEALDLSRRLAPARFGALAIGWSELVRSAHPQQLSIFYLPVELDRQFVGLGILYVIHQLDISKFMDRRVHAVARQVARLGFSPLSLRVGFLEIPLMNLPGLVLLPEYEHERDAIQAQMMQLVQERLDVHGLCVKIASAAPGPITSARRALCLPFLQSAELPLDYQDYDAFLRRLPKKRRYNARHDRRMLEEHGVSVETWNRVGDRWPRLYELFRVVAANAADAGRLPTPIEMQPSLFRRLDTLGPDTFHVHALRHGGELIGFLLVLRAHDGRYAKYYGADNHLSRTVMAYFNLQLYEVEHAIAGGCRRLDLGVTTYPFKRRLGCQFHPTSFLVDLYHPVLKPVAALVAGRLGQAADNEHDEAMPEASSMPHA
jgi:predicted N-acyltransferase